MFSTSTLHHYMESCIIIQYYAVLSGIAMEKQAVFIKTQAVNIIYILRKNFKQNWVNNVQDLRQWPSC